LAHRKPKGNTLFVARVSGLPSTALPKGLKGFYREANPEPEARIEEEDNENIFTPWEKQLS